MRPAAAELARRLAAFADEHETPALDRLERAGVLCDAALARAANAPTQIGRSQRPAG